jgi:hypothetical protein
MKAENLMVGDWVLVKELDYSNATNVISEHQYQLRLKDFAEMYNAGEYKEYEPIPLTKEILLKNGFEDFSGGGCIIKKLDDDEMPTLYIWDGNNAIYVVDEYSMNKYTYIKDCKYVHEFQHELKSCGIDKGIVL